MVNIAKKAFARIFPPACKQYGNNIGCPVLFTSKMYQCVYYNQCQEKTLIEWQKKLDGWRRV